jgi:hypothetical protein
MARRSSAAAPLSAQVRQMIDVHRVVPATRDADIKWRWKRVGDRDRPCGGE